MITIGAFAFLAAFLAMTIAAVWFLMCLTQAEEQRDIARDALVEAMRENAILKGTTWLGEKR